MSSGQHGRPVDRTAFEIAIICALRLESDTIEAVFDEFWEKDDDEQYGKAPGDPNSYTLGRIGRHDVVLAYMPGMGKGNSASVAASFRSSFPNIRLGLVVGICGGVPQPEAQEDEIFLGDVIISTGVVQFDFGRQVKDRVVRKNTLQDNLGRPNIELRSLLTKAQGWRARSELRRRISASLTEICSKEGFDGWSRPGPEEDTLYQASYRHKHHDPAVCTTCAQCVEADSAVCEAALKLSCVRLQCDESHLIRRARDRRVSASADSSPTSTQPSPPAIHFGLIGSGDVVMKSALHRDRIAAEEDVIGFEMEGAGVWDNFPTIVIKGVCDYADSHKNKRWQKYASVTAAACAKALLGEWRGIDRGSAPPPDSSRTVEPRRRTDDQREGEQGRTSELEEQGKL
jgi:nucleoside phosphorylase